MSLYADQIFSAQTVAPLGPSIIYTGFRLYRGIPVDLCCGIGDRDRYHLRAGAAQPVPLSDTRNVSQRHKLNYCRSAHAVWEQANLLGADRQRDVHACSVLVLPQPVEVCCEVLGTYAREVQ